MIFQHPQGSRVYTFRLTDQPDGSTVVEVLSSKEWLYVTKSRSSIPTETAAMAINGYPELMGYAVEKSVLKNPSLRKVYHVITSEDKLKRLFKFPD